MTSTLNTTDDKPTTTGFRISPRLVPWIREAMVKESMTAANALVEASESNVREWMADEPDVERAARRHEQWLAAVRRPRQMAKLATHLGGLHVLTSEPVFVPLKRAADLLEAIDWLENDLRAQIELGWDGDPDWLQNLAEVLGATIQLRDTVADHVPNAPAPAPGNRGLGAIGAEATPDCAAAPPDLASYGPSPLDALTDGQRYAAVDAILQEGAGFARALVELHERFADAPADEWFVSAADFESNLRTLGNLHPTLRILVDGAKPRTAAVTTPRVVLKGFAVAGEVRDAPDQDQGQGQGRDMFANLLGHIRRTLPLMPEDSAIARSLRRALDDVAEPDPRVMHLLPPRVANGIMLAISYRILTHAESLNGEPVVDLETSPGDAFKIAADARAIAELTAVGDQLEWRTHWGRFSNDPGPVTLHVAETTLVTILDAASTRYQDGLRGSDEEREVELLGEAMRHVAGLIAAGGSKPDMDGQSTNAEPVHA
jgi:hypothetical protein